MAGRARTKALLAALDRHSRTDIETEEGDATPTHLDWVCYRVESGASLVSLIAELSKETKLELTYSMLSGHLRRTFGETEVDTALQLARSRSAHYLAEKSLEIVGERPDDKLDVSWAANRAKQMSWTAERYNRKDYGQQKDPVSVQVNVGTLFLDALRKQTIAATVETASPTVGRETTAMLATPARTSHLVDTVGS